MPEQAGVRCQWQLQLEDYCQKNGSGVPVFTTFSDRRGGRTAWTCTVEVRGQKFDARYWYDGKYLDNAKEDAAEKALKTLSQQPNTRQEGFQGSLERYQQV